MAHGAQLPAAFLFGSWVRGQDSAAAMAKVKPPMAPVGRKLSTAERIAML